MAVSATTTFISRNPPSTKRNEKPSVLASLQFVYRRLARTTSGNDHPRWTSMPAGVSEVGTETERHEIPRIPGSDIDSQATRRRKYAKFTSFCQSPGSKEGTQLGSTSRRGRAQKEEPSQRIVRMNAVRLREAVGGQVGIEAEAFQRRVWRFIERSRAEGLVRCTVAWPEISRRRWSGQGRGRGVGFAVEWWFHHRRPRAIGWPTRVTIVLSHEPYVPLRPGRGHPERGRSARPAAGSHSVAAVRSNG